MDTKFKLRKQAITSNSTTSARRQQIVEALTVLNGSTTGATACMEGVVDILGTLHARMAAGEPILQDMDQRAITMLTGIVAGAKILMDYPEAAEAHNLTPNRLRQVIQQTDLNTAAAQTMLAVTASAPTVLREVSALIRDYNEAVKSGDQAAMESAKQTIQRMWLYWQRNS